jgi:hypothetical protein
MPAVQSLGPQASSLLPGNNFSGDGKKDDLLLNLIKILTDISFYYAPLNFTRGQARCLRSNLWERRLPACSPVTTLVAMANKTYNF